MAGKKHTIIENVNFILSHFVGQEFLFPRSIMTTKTSGQVFVSSEDQMMQYFEVANFVDCRINGYPFHHEEEKRSCILVSFSLTWIYLYALLVSTIRKLDYILKQTLNKIKEEINGHPTVLWTGGGYHIYQPNKIETRDKERPPLETFREFEEFTYSEK